MSAPLHIFIDSKEASKQRMIISYLKLSGLQVEVKNLDVCDYVVSDRVGVERKEASDFLSSLKDGRLFNQARDMAHLYEKPILIIEGEMKRALKRSYMRPSSIYGAMASIALDYGVTIMPTDDPESTAILLHRLCYREQVKQERTIQLRSIKRSLPLHQQQIYLLSGLPQIGTALAEELLNKFQTPYEVLVKFAEAEIRISPSGKTKRLLGPLADIKGVGPTIVENIQQLLHQEYPKLVNEK